jgi:hypothetical protein
MLCFFLSSKHCGKKKYSTKPKKSFVLNLFLTTEIKAPYQRFLNKPCEETVKKVLQIEVCTESQQVIGKTFRSRSSVPNLSHVFL